MRSSDNWDSCASEYDTISQEVTNPCIAKMLEQAALLPVTSSARTIKVIDVAAGPGLLGTLLGEAYSQARYLDKVSVLSTDFSSNMVKLAERRFTSHNWPSPQFSARTLDATNLIDIPSGFYTHAFCSFGIMMVPDAPKALNEMFRVLEPSGTIGITTWQKLGWIPIVSECLARAKRSSAKEENPTILPALTVNWSEASYVQKTLEDAGFHNVQVNIFESGWSFANQYEFVKQFTESQFINMFLKDVNLTDEQREKYHRAMPQVLLDMVGKKPDEPLDLPMIAIIASGQKSVE